LVEQIYNDFQELQLVYLPRISRVSTSTEALQIIQERKFDLVITMNSLLDSDVFKLGEAIKEKQPQLPVVLLLTNPMVIDAVNQHPKHKVFDAVFFWAGDAMLFSSIIRCMEDRLNLIEDIGTGLVKIIVVVDDSIQSYSQLLPVVYQEIMRQTHCLMQEELNEVQKILRSRARPKILLAASIEEATAITSKHKTDLLGIICKIAWGYDSQDIRGYTFANDTKKTMHDLPVIVIADNQQQQSVLNTNGLAFVHKDSPTFRNDLKNFIVWNMGFGDFVFRLPTGQEVGRARNIKEFQEVILKIPDESLRYHALRNHISLWLLARGEYGLALEFRPKNVEDFCTIQELKGYIADAIAAYRNKKQSGVVVKYRPGDWDSSFIQIGNGSLGGKGRGIAFINYLLATRDIASKFPQVHIRIPKTVALTTEQFDQFLDHNNLRNTYLLGDDQEICRKFVDAPMPMGIIEPLSDFIKQCRRPIAIRSSSLLEDSQYLPFAGIYSTYMLANNHSNDQMRLENLLRMIKLVYASVFFKCSRAYLEATPYKLEEEKMAVVIQEIVGQAYDQYFYPTFSGVAQSYNFYPISHMEPQDGAAQVAMGLGRLVIEGGNAIRFCPKYPDILPQFANVPETLRNAQNYFYALDLQFNPEHVFNEGDTLARLNTAQAAFSVLQKVSSIYNYEDNRISDDMSSKQGFRVLTFRPILYYQKFPLAEILAELLPILRESIGKDIEMEFAVNMFENEHIPSVFNILQVRPLVVNKEDMTISPDERQKEHLLCYSSKALGNGLYHTTDIVYVSPEKFDKTKTREIASEVAKINAILKEEQRNYLLIGIGRWGTTDPWLGIPVSWDEISNVVAMVEVGISRDFFADASLGSHFFQNITSRGVAYFTITGKKEQDFVDWLHLQGFPSIHDFTFVRHVHIPGGIAVKIDGKIGEGVILKSKASRCQSCNKRRDCDDKKDGNLMETCKL